MLVVHQVNLRTEFVEIQASQLTQACIRFFNTHANSPRCIENSIWKISFRNLEDNFWGVNTTLKIYYGATRYWK